MLNAEHNLTHNTFSSLFSCTSRPVCILSVSVFVLQVLGLLAGRWWWLSILRGLNLFILLLSSMLLRPFLSGGLHRFLPMLQLCRVRGGVRLQLWRKHLRLLHVRHLSTDGWVSGARHGTLSASVSLAAQSHCHLYNAHDNQIRLEWEVANVMCWFHKHVNLLVDCGYETARLHLILHQRKNAYAVYISTELQYIKILKFLSSSLQFESKHNWSNCQIKNYLYVYIYGKTMLECIILNVYYI